jgi:putative addiction module killer protein
METQKKEIIIYKNQKNISPYKNWFLKLNGETKRRIFERLIRVEQGNLGDHKKIEGIKGLFEFRFKFGSGYRVYFAIKNHEIIILLAGGDKSSQKKDIKKQLKY